MAAIHKERSSCAIENDITFAEWSFKINNIELMTMNGVRYDEIYMIMGGGEVHWMFSEIGTPKIVFDSADLPLSYCSCCFNLQYLNAISAIKNYVENK